MENIQTNAKQAHEVAKNLINQRIKSKLPDLKIGAQVWLDSQHIQIKGAPKKLTLKCIGLFKILKGTGPVNYQLKLPSYWKMHPIFHIHLLWPTQENTQYGKFSERPLPKIIIGEEKWEVKDIIDSRTKNRVKEFLVHWKGYSKTEHIQKLETNLTNAKQLLKVYKGRCKGTTLRSLRRPGRVRISQRSHGSSESVVYSSLPSSSGLHHSTTQPYLVVQLLLS